MALWKYVRIKYKDVCILLQVIYIYPWLFAQEINISLQIYHPLKVSHINITRLS